MPKLLSDQEIIQALREARSDPNFVQSVGQAADSANAYANQWGGEPLPLWAKAPTRKPLDGWQGIAKGGYIGSPPNNPYALYNAQAVFPAWIADLDTPAGAWRQSAVLLGGANPSKRAGQALNRLKAGDFAGFFGELFAATQEVGYELSHMAYSLALSVREFWQTLITGQPADLSSKNILDAFNTIPLQVASLEYLQRALGFSGQWASRYKGSDGFVLIPLVAPYPEGIRVRVSSQSQELPYLLGSLPGAYTSRPASKEISIKNLYLDLRPLAAYLMRSAEADQPLAGYVRGSSMANQMINQSMLARLSDITLAYLEFLAKPDPALGRKHRLALRYGNSRHGVPPGYLTIESFDYETMLHTPGGNTLLAQVNLELREWAGLDW